MKIVGRGLASRQIAACLVLTLAASLSYGAELPSTSAGPQEVASAATSSAPAVFPDAPAPQQAPAPGDQQTPTPTPDQAGQAQKPEGTAAGPVTRPTGVAGSRPAGAAIAPSKQKRVRRILIRMGIIIGAAAAVGTVVALSEGSSSRP